MNAIPSDRMRRKAGKTVKGALAEKAKVHIDQAINAGFVGKKVRVADGRAARNKLARMEAAPAGRDRGDYENAVREKWKPQG